MHRPPQLLVHFPKCTELKPTAYLYGKIINIYLRNILQLLSHFYPHVRTYTTNRALLNMILKQTKRGRGARKTFDGFDPGSRESNRLRPRLRLRLQLRVKYPDDSDGSGSKHLASGKFCTFPALITDAEKYQRPGCE